MLNYYLYSYSFIDFVNTEYSSHHHDSYRTVLQRIEYVISLATFVLTHQFVLTVIILNSTNCTFICLITCNLFSTTAAAFLGTISVCL